MDRLRGPQGTIWGFVVGSNYKNPWRTTHFGCEWMERQSSLQPSNRASPVPYGASTSICIAPMDPWVRRRQYDAALWSITPKRHGERPLLVVNGGEVSQKVQDCNHQIGRRRCRMVLAPQYALHQWIRGCVGDNMMLCC